MSTIWLMKLKLQLLGLMLVVVCVGCRQEVAPPAPIPIEALPSILEQKFATAGSAQKEIVIQILGQLKAPNYPLVYQGLQTLAAQSGLSKEQSQTLASALLTVNNQLQAAQSQGDKAAAKALQYHRETK